MNIETTQRPVLSCFQFKLRMIPIQPQAPEMPSQLSLFYATSLEIYQVARWCRASPEHTLSDLPIVNDPKDLKLKDDGMALCLYDDTMKVWSTTRDWVSQWGELGQRITDALQKNPTIQDSWDQNLNHLNMGYESLQNFREDMWVVDNGSIRPVPSPFMLTNSLDEEVKKMEAAYINLPCEESEETQPPQSPLTEVSDSATTPPLSPCSLFESPDSLCSPCFLPGLPFQSPFFLTFSPSPVPNQTISPCDVFSPLPQLGGESTDDTAMEVQTPPTPVVPSKSLPEMSDDCLDLSPLSPPDPPLPRSPSPPIAGPSRIPLKRSRWSEDESDDENDEFVPQARKRTCSIKRTKVIPSKRPSTKFEGKGTRCDLCGARLGRVTDLPRHKASCRSNPERAARTTPCEYCGKLLPVRADAVKRHLASKTCLSKRNGKGDDEDPYLSES